MTPVQKKVLKFMADNGGKVFFNAGRKQTRFGRHVGLNMPAVELSWITAAPLRDNGWIRQTEPGIYELTDAARTVLKGFSP